MSDYPVLTRETAPDASVPLLDATQQAFGFIPNLIGVMANTPALLEAYTAVSAAFDKSDLSATERQVVLLTVSHYHACDYCVAAHSAIAGMQKVPKDVVSAIRNGEPFADEKLQALRNLVIALLNRRGWLEQADRDAFLAAGYKPRHVLDVLVGIAQKTMSNYTNHLAGTPLDEMFRAFAWQGEVRRTG